MLSVEQTSLRGRRAETDPEKQKKHLEAVLLYLSGLSLNAIAFLKSVVPSTIASTLVPSLARARRRKAA